MKACKIIFPAVVLIWTFVALLGCGSGSEAVDTKGLNQVTLRIEGMT